MNDIAYRKVKNQKMLEVLFSALKASQFNLQFTEKRIPEKKKKPHVTV